MTTEFIPGVWYPIEMLDMLPHGNWFTKGSFVSIDWIKQTHFTVNKRTVIETSKPKLPTVPEFIWADQLKPGDLLQIYDYDDLLVVTGIAPKDQQILPKYPIYAASTNFSSQGLTQYSRQGYNNIINHGNKDDDHIIRIERNGVTVAEGQVYDD